jgi:hypothetical protein
VPSLSPQKLEAPALVEGRGGKLRAREITLLWTSAGLDTSGYRTFEVALDLSGYLGILISSGLIEFPNCATIMGDFSQRGAL